MLAAGIPSDVVEARAAGTTPDDAVLVLVAGPSGAGKTIFINQFRAGTLAPELSDLLPAQAAHWPQVGANDCMKRGVGMNGVLPKNWSAPGAVVHYDTAYIHRFGVSRYEDDPVAELFRRAKRAIVVSIAPPADTLTAQYDDRMTRMRGAKKRSHLFWRDHVRAPIERTLVRLKGLEPRETRDLYRDPDWIARCYAEWDQFVRGLVGTKPGSRMLTLEPCAGAERGPSFRIVSMV
ncbi:MAG: hypothetical protein ACT4N2_00635 [Hyphomicrobium sp.]